MAKANIELQQERNDMLADLQAISHMADIADELMRSAVENWSGDQAGVLPITRKEIERLEFAVNDASERAAAAYARWRDLPLPAAVPAPGMRIERPIEDSISLHMSRMESHVDIHRLLEVFVDVEKVIAAPLAHIEVDDDRPVVDLLSAMSRFVGSQIEALHSKARNTPPISRMDGEKRALTMIAYRMSCSSFASEIIDDAQRVLAELDRMQFPAEAGDAGKEVDNA
jgi:hypothetical protein